MVACHSMGQLHAALLMLPEASAVAVTENRADLSPKLVSLVRSVSGVPLNLFQGDDPYYDESEFDLVIPTLDTPDNWLKVIGTLIARPSRRELRM